MAAGGSSKASVGALEATLDRKLQTVTNTMESIQSLSSWCIENKKHHTTIVHYWLKWLRRSSVPHRLNLFYLANDVIQNCKRKNAIVYREAFSEALPEAASLVRDQSVVKAVERIFKIWEERNVYSEDTIASFRSGLSGAWGKRERSERSRSSRARVAEKVPEAVATNSKAALKSKIVAEFRPQKLIDDLSTFKRSVDHVDLKEKQLSNMRVDVCSTETLKRLKDKAGGKKFSKDFEEASAKLEEFVNILDKQVKNGPSLTDALENAGIFYEAQYKEVKIVVNAYKTFANRVNNLKKKLDQLKASLPDPEESPMPSPTMDAPSPTGSESPFQGMGAESPLSPEPEPIPAVSPEPPKDNRVVEDMELSDVDADEEMPNIIIEERKETPTHPASSSKAINNITEASKTIPDSTNTPSVATLDPTPTSVPVSSTASVLVSTATPVSTSPPTAQTAPAKPVTTPTIAPSMPLGLPNLPNVDLGKISSILSSLTSVMKNTGVSPAGKPSPGTPTTPTTNLGGGLKPPAQGQSNPLANILSKVEITPESILSVLSKTQVTSTPSLQGFSSFIQSVAMSSGTVTHSTSTAPVNSGLSTMKDRTITTSVTPSVPKTFGYSTPSSNSESSSLPVAKTPVSHGSKPQVNTMAFSSQPPMPAEKSITQAPQTSKSSDATEPSSLEMKIHNFLKGNPGFSGLDLNIPILTGIGSNTVPEAAPEFHRGSSSTSLDNVDGTPVRDERSGTPTQDEMMDKPASSGVDTVSLLSKIISPDSSTPSSTRSPLLNKESEFQKLASMPAYRSFGMGGNSPNAYRQPGDSIEKALQLDSSMGKFYSNTVFPEDEDYRDFEFSGPPPSAIGSLEKRPSKPIMKPNVHLESSEYQSMPPGFGQNQDFGRQPFPQSMHGPFHSGDGSGPLSPTSELYGNRNLRRGNLDVNKTPSPKKEESFFPSDNHNLPVARPVMSQSPYTNSPHALQNRPHNFAPKNNLPSSCAPMTNVEQPGSSVSASSMMEFKNMLKNASHRPDENKYGPTSLHEDVGGPGHTGMASDERSHQEEHYRIETRVSSSCANLSDGTEEKGAPIETLGYHSAGNVRLSGEPIKTVESVRVGVKGNRGHGIDGSRGGWYEMGTTGSSFDDGPSSSADDPPSISGGFKTQYEDHLPRFPDTGDFRGKNMPPFEHHLPPPPMGAPIEHGVAFQMERAGPPPGPPPPDHGSLFGRDIPVTARMSSVEPPNPLSHVAHPPPGEHVNPFPGHLPPEHGSMPFSPPPRLDMRSPFTQDHGTVHQGAMKEHFGVHPASRDHGPPSHDHNGPPHGRGNEAMAPNSRDHHGLHSGPPHHFVPSHRDNMNPGGLRPQRQQFRPREPYNSLKRPRPPFGRGPQFFSPKRPFYPPRY
ncbi:regulation of nuclear pre-mRNA domain-containing protein 2 [Spea bombifrons]|uniref:regulation of nuclear pre-mRNA domain-containing protein 2 n=1 Tax=Spea bombifrons TaxID=233779 RepID=UPI002349EB4F|nr:regulation of nuclear pre-mRNA domain-containing protein 2 [Spea bombifrons]